MLQIEIKPELDKKLKKIKKKNLKEFNNIKKKIIEISYSDDYSINHYKNLRKPLQSFKRVHINTSFVLIFEYNKDESKIVFMDYQHHDKIYK